MATPTKTPSTPAETPIYFETLAAAKTTEPKFRNDTKALDPQSWSKAVEAQ